MVSVPNSNNKGYRWGFLQGSRDPRPQWLVQGVVMWLNRSQWEATGMWMGMLGPRNFLCFFVLFCFSEALDLVLPSCDRQGWKCQGHQEKLKDGLNEEKMGPRIRKKKRGEKRASYLYSLDPYFQLCSKSAVAERWDKKLFLVLNPVGVSVICNRNRQKPVCLGN